MGPLPDGEAALRIARRAARRRRLALLLLCAPAIGLAACKVTPEDIQRWKETEKGPGKLRDALHSGSASAEIRAQALVALVEIGMTAEAQEELKNVPDAERQPIVAGAAKPLMALAQGGGRSGLAVTGKMRKGQDALFVLRDWASPADRALLDDALVEWSTADLMGRANAGAHSAEKVLTAVGPRAGPKLAALATDPGQSDETRVEAARLLGRVADRPAREQAGAALVEEAKRKKRPTELLLQALGLVGGDHAVAWLCQLASDPRQPGALRAKSILALGQSPDPAALPTALRLAGDPRAPGEVRDAAFELAEKMGPTAVPGLARFLDDKDELIRWRAVEAVLTAGRAQAIPTALEGLPLARAYSKEDLISYVVHQLTPLGPPALPVLRDMLKSRSWVARLAAAEAIAEIGRADDADRIQQLASDDTRLKGWPGSPTLGAEARTLAAALRQRR